MTNAYKLSKNKQTNEQTNKQTNTIQDKHINLVKIPMFLSKSATLQ